MSANSPLAPPSPASAPGRSHKRVQWRKPKGTRRPGVIDATRAELVRCIEQRSGHVWARIKHRVAVSGYTLDRANERIRALRSDGAESLLAMVVALLYMSDVRTGFVGKPRAGGGRWQRYSLRDIAQLAYGAQGDADVRRASRALSSMVSLGWAIPTKQVRRMTAESTFRSEPGVRWINLKRICEMAGTSWLLKRDRVHLDQKYGSQTASFEEARARREAKELRLQEQKDRKALLTDELRDRVAWNGVAGSTRPRSTGGLASLGDALESLFD